MRLRERREKSCGALPAEGREGVACRRLLRCSSIISQHLLLAPFRWRISRGGAICKRGWLYFLNARLRTCRAGGEQQINIAAQRNTLTCYGGEEKATRISPAIAAPV